MTDERSHRGVDWAQQDTSRRAPVWAPVRAPVGARAGHDRASRRAGRAGWFLLALVLAAGALFALRGLDGRSNDTDDPLAARTEGAVAPGDGDGATTELEAAEAAAPRADAGPVPMGPGIDVREIGEYARRARSYDGRGTLAGSVTVEGGLPMPLWTLHIEPSALGRGREHATTRVLEAEPGQATFEERDLPMGGYRVFATADGFRSRVTEVALFRLEGDALGRGLDYLHVDLVLRRTGSVSGSVLDADGGVADDLELFLVPATKGQRDDTRQAVSLRTDINGRYAFGDVAAGLWHLNVGHATHPVVPAVPVPVELDHVELDPIQLPILARIDLYIADEAARPFPNVEVFGYLKGRTAGRIRGRTGPMGHFEARYLVPGRWRIEADVPDEPGDIGGRYDYTVDATTEVQKLEMAIRERE